MDIDSAHFRQQLLPILKAISGASIITFDLEMSGIATRPKFSAGDRSHNVGKITLQQQYAEMKSAAEKYQVLQIGITCISEDHERDYYLARPYNFTLSPLEADGVDLRLNRDFTFSSSASGFLAKNGFDFGKVFKEGVPYLSRNEEIGRVKEYKQRADWTNQIPDIIVTAEDHNTMDFLQSARLTVTAWLTDPKPKSNFVNVASTAGPLNGFQRRLVHQFIRNEFPTLRTFPRMDGSFMQVEKFDEAKELAIQNSRQASFNAKIAKQTGMRWIFEALSGGDLSGIDPEWFCRGLELKEAIAVKEEFKNIVKALEGKKQIIVGHNLFTDLGFLYKTFIGTLPTSVKRFQEAINELFPFIIDTKYLATHGTDNMNPRSNLKELLAPFREVHVPLIVLHEDHTSYGTKYGKDHEAGYDSWMTAELFVKLAAKLYAQRKDTLDEVSGSDSEEFLSAPEEHLAEHDESDGGAELAAVSSDEDLIGFSGDGSFGDSHPPEWHAKQMNPGAVAASSSGSEGEVDVGDEKEPEAGQWLPRMKHSFWDIYVNKLRVTACEGGVCDLAEHGGEEDVGDVGHKLTNL
ncbi:hypothetical protein EG329_005047 [Mollisiaceae sp. DMI_Dod_QoI]|nr:hypothetical protein EG329_005047 [Helotiales sp. DMI_Dod_QoI]